MLFLEAVKTFLRFCEVERQLSPHTLQAYGSDLSDLGKWLQGTTSLSEISTDTLKDYLKSMVVDRKLTSTTVRRRLACLRVFSRYVSPLTGWTNPFVEWRPLMARRKRLPRSLSRAEATSLVSSARENAAANFLETAIRLMISTGIRVGELCALRTQDVSPEGSTLRIHGKGARDRVSYVVDADLRKRLQHLVSRHQQAGRNGGPLFLNRVGLPLRPQSVRSTLRRRAENVGIARRVTPHMLRHTAATLLIESGVDIRFVQRLLGHSSLATTEIYTHVSDEALRIRLELANVLESLSSSTSSKASDRRAAERMGF